MKIKTTILYSLLVVGVTNLGLAQSQVESNQVEDEFQYSDGLTEDVSKRDLYSKHFQIEDGRYEAYICSGPVHFENSQGEFEDINTTIQPSDGLFIYENKTNNLESFFPADIADGVTVSIDGKFIVMGQSLRMLALDANANLISTLDECDEAYVDATGNKAVYSNVFSNAYSEYVVERAALKNNIVLDAMPANIPSNAAYLAISEIITLPNGLRLIDGQEDITGTRVLSGGIKIVDAESEWSPYIPVPDVYELNDESTTVFATGNWDKSYKVTNLGNGQYEIQTLVPMSWLNEQGRSFPVVVDPTVTLNGSLGGWMNANSAINNSSYYTFTGANYSNTTYRAWTKWNISAIPSGSIVLNSELEMFLNGGTGGVDTIDVNDVTTTYGNYSGYSSTVFADFADGFNVAFACSTINQSYGWIDLSPACDSDIEDQIGLTWFQLAFDMVPGTSNYKRFTATSNRLRIEYVQCTGQLGGSVAANALNNFGFHIDCFGDTTGSITATGTGGSNYTYQWSGPNGFVDSVASISGLEAGQYFVTIYSGTICPAYFDTTITGPAELFMNDSASNFGGFNVSCFDGDNGELYLDPSGSTGTFTYSWSGPNSFTSTAQSNTGLEGGWYYITITESNASCTKVDSVQLTRPAAIYMIVDSTKDAFCEFDENGMAAVTGSGGIQSYSFLWDNGETGPQATMLDAGMHTVTLTDAFGCESDQSVEIGFENEAPVVDLGGADTGYCDGGSIILNAGGGFASYTWNNGQTGQLNQVTALGTFTVTVTTFGGCEGFDEINVSEVYDLPEPDLGPNINQLASPVVLDPGEYKYYVWSTGSLDSVISVGANGTYSVTVTDFHDCKGSDEIKVKFWAQGVSDVDNSAQFEMYPNPASAVLTISGISESAASTLNIYDTQGQIVMSKMLIGANINEQVDVATLPNGVYLIEMRGASTQWRSSFIKQ